MCNKRQNSGFSGAFRAFLPVWSPDHNRTRCGAFGRPSLASYGQPIPSRPGFRLPCGNHPPIPKDTESDPARRARPPRSPARSPARFSRLLPVSPNSLFAPFFVLAEKLTLSMFGDIFPDGLANTLGHWKLHILGARLKLISQISGTFESYHFVFYRHFCYFSWLTIVYLV